MSPVVLEAALLWLGVVAYGAGAVLACIRIQDLERNRVTVLVPLCAAVLCVALAVATRWLRTGDGPFLTLYEVLLSNTFSLGLVYVVAVSMSPRIAAGAPAALSTLLILGLWTASVPPVDTELPPTYDNPWLWVHVIAGKLFLGAGLAAAALCLRLLWSRSRAAGGADTRDYEPAIWNAMAAAFVFQSLMLVAGAAWAQDAWGRMWAWDPLETWSLLTWLVLAVTLHARVAYTVPLRLGWSAVIGMFVLALLTFLGVPFVSVAVHKGIV